MHTLRILSLVSLALGLLLGGCGPRGLPQRSSPVLEPTGASPVLDGLSQRDLRRDGVFVVSTAEAQIVQRMTNGVVTELFRLTSPEFGGPDFLVSRADNDIVVGFYDQLVHWNGTAVTDLIPRLEGAVIIAHPIDNVSIDAVDLAADGTIVVGVNVGGQGEDAPFGQLCRLGPTGSDSCEPLEALNGDELANASAVLVEGTRTYLLLEGDERLYVREGTGAFSLVTNDRVVFLVSIEGGRVGYVRDGGSGSSALHVLGPDGIEERRVADAWFVAGHSAAGLWENTVDSEGDGSCSSLSWSTCTESTIWTQLIVMHLGDSRREVAHLDYASEPVVLPLADGSMRLEIDGQVYEVAPP